MKQVYIDNYGNIYEGEMADLIEERDRLDEEHIDSISNSKLLKGLNKQKESNKMKNLKGKVVMTGSAFMKGVKGTFTDGENIAIAGATGLTQALKYKGDVKAGVKGAAIVMGGLALINGVGTVIVNKDKIMKA